MTASVATEPAPAATQAAEIAEFVRAVRNELADLPALTVEELVGGLGADLTALVDDSGLPLRQVVAEPATYAAELRAAADLPAGAGSRSKSRRVGVIDWLRGTPPVAALQADTPLRREALAFARTVLPAWWVVRGIAVAAVANFVINTAGIALFLLYVAAAIASVQIGRRHRERQEGKGRLDRAADIIGVVLVVLTLPVFLGFLTWGFSGEDRYYTYVDQDLSAQIPGSGVVINGAAAGNLFVYGADGRLIRDARILDDQGQLLQLSDSIGYVDPRSGQEYRPVGYQGATGVSWGVFPLDVGVYDEVTFEYDSTQPTAAPPPALTLPALDTTASAAAETSGPAGRSR